MDDVLILLIASPTRNCTQTSGPLRESLFQFGLKARVTPFQLDPPTLEPPVVGSWRKVLIGAESISLFVEYTPWLYTRQHCVVALMRLREVFATNLRRARNAAQLSQEALADIAGIDRGYVSELERGNYAVTVDMIETIADALNIEPAEMLRIIRLNDGGDMDSQAGNPAK